MTVADHTYRQAAMETFAEIVAAPYLSLVARGVPMDAAIEIACEYVASVMRTDR